MWKVKSCNPAPNTFCSAVLKTPRRACVVDGKTDRAVWCVRVAKAIAPIDPDARARTAVSPDGHYLVVVAWAPVYRPSQNVVFAYRDGKLIWRLRASEAIEERDVRLLVNDKENWLAGAVIQKQGVVTIFGGETIVREFNLDTGKFIREVAIPHSPAEAIRKAK